MKCSNCKSSFDKTFLIGKQGNTDTCPMCGSKLSKEDEHPDWITWYYYGLKEDNGKSTILFDKPINLTLEKDKYFLIKEFKAPKRDAHGNAEKARKILRTYVPDAFAENPQPARVQCPYCLSYDIQLVPRKFSLLTGFATNKVDRVCVRCKRKF